MLNLMSPREVLLETAAALEADVLPHLSGAGERRQCRSAIFLVRLVAGALPAIEVDGYPELPTDGEAARRALERWIAMTPPLRLGRFVHLDQSPAEELAYLTEPDG